MSKQKIKKEKTVEAQIRQRTILSFSVFILMLCFAYLGWKYLYKGEKEKPEITAGAVKPLRSILNLNEKIFNKSFSNNNLVKTYPKEKAAKNVRVNGAIGMKSLFDPENWKLQVVRNPGDTLFIDIDDIKKLPKTEIIFDFKCIEGWSQITHWGGVKLSDFMEHYKLQSNKGYISLYTPDRQYYVGIDMASALHPQTILCYEMNDEPLPNNQGYPLRLIIPVKYGIKSLKRIGTLSFSNIRPPDYWAERGYDYYSGL